VYTFLIIVFLVYGGMHAYAFAKAYSGLALSPPAGAALAAVMALMLISPFLVRFLERNEYELLAALLGYAGYSWMGFIFLFCCLSLAVDIYRLAAWAMNLISIQAPVPAAFAAFIAPCAAAVLISVYGLYEAHNIRTEYVTLETYKLIGQRDKIRIVQVSDIHLGLIVGPKRMEKILAAVREARPDILVSTGDLIDGNTSALRRSMEMFEQVNPPLGKFAVTGNHEFYAGIDKSVAATREAGFMVLRQECFTIPGVIRIAGVDDRGETGSILPDNSIDAKTLSRVTREFTLFLKHRPAINHSALDMFDLQLSGHAHRGQIFPFRLVTRLFFPLDSGLYRLSEGSHLYTSRGTGTWGPPIRFLAPPEVTVIDLVKK
jgi:predicted MPP superfamily phosphohydrolase